MSYWIREIVYVHFFKLAFLYNLDSIYLATLAPPFKTLSLSLILSSLPSSRAKAVSSLPFSTSPQTEQQQSVKLSSVHPLPWPHPNRLPCVVPGVEAGNSFPIIKKKLSVWTYHRSVWCWLCSPSRTYPCRVGASRNSRTLPLLCFSWPLFGTGSARPQIWKGIFLFKLFFFHYFLRGFSPNSFTDCVALFHTQLLPCCCCTGNAMAVATHTTHTLRQHTTTRRAETAARRFPFVEQKNQLGNRTPPEFLKIP